MPVLRLQVSIGADSAFPRDRFVMTPHFSVGFDLADPTALGHPDANALCNDMAEGLSQRFYPTNGREIEVKAYDAQGTRPVYPVGHAIRNVGLFPESPNPRELALCLSFYSGRNAPRSRGRLYFPLPCIGGGGALPARPPVSMRDGMTNYALFFQGLGGTNVDWVIYSRRDNVARPVTNWWCDDEWDVQRRRGFRGTTRTTGTTSEA